VADRGIPVFVVPGNHERGLIPQLRFAQHPRIHLFDGPRTFTAEVRGVRIAFAGVPSERHDVRAKFVDLVEQTDWRAADAHVRLLCMHQRVEGATVGPNDFTFTTASDVISARPAAWIPLRALGAHSSAPGADAGPARRIDSCTGALSGLDRAHVLRRSRRDERLHGGGRDV
jgi:hypothetical protein